MQRDLPWSNDTLHDAQFFLAFKVYCFTVATLAKSIILIDKEFSRHFPCNDDLFLWILLIFFLGGWGGGGELLLSFLSNLEKLCNESVAITSTAVPTYSAKLRMKVFDNARVLDLPQECQNLLTKFVCPGPIIRSIDDVQFFFGI